MTLLKEAHARTLSARLEELQLEEAKLLATIEQAWAEETAQNHEAARAGASAYDGIGSPAHRARKKRETAERKLRQLRSFELPTALDAALEATREAAEEQLSLAKKAARKFDSAEQGALERAAGAFREFCVAFGELADAAEARERLILELKESNSAVMRLDDNERHAVEQEFRSTLPLFPASPEVLFEALTLAAAGQVPSGGYDVEHVAPLVSGTPLRRAALRPSTLRRSFTGPLVETR